MLDAVNGFLRQADHRCKTALAQPQNPTGSARFRRKRCALKVEGVIEITPEMMRRRCDGHFHRSLLLPH
jgi:hypothetical protein